MATLYFGYGSNLWLDQMKRRCPSSKYIGIATLRDWKWIINNRHVANIIPSPGDIVYGMIYSLTPKDEEALDGFESVPYAYVKNIFEVEMADGEKVDSLVYVDVKRLDEDTPRAEYVGRMNYAISDALEKGIPKDYVDKYLRPFIPELA